MMSVMAVMMVWAAARRQACITVSAERGAQRRERHAKKYDRRRGLGRKPAENQKEGETDGDGLGKE